MILETSIDGFCVVGVDGKLLEVNSSLCDITGYSKEELLRMKIIDIEAVETVKQTAQHIDRVMNRGYDRFETKHRRKDGKIIDIEVSSQFCDFEQEKFFFSCFRDITKRKKAEQALRESEQKFKTIFDNATDGILVADPETRKYLTGNKMICQMLGYSLEEIKNLEVKDIHPKDSLSEDLRKFEKVLKREIRLSEDVPVRRKDGSIFYVDINTSFLVLGGKECLMGIFRDITERKKGEEALRESENKYRTLVENIPQKIFFKDKNSVYVSCNDNLARDLKIKSEEIAGKTDYDLAPKELAEKYRADDKRIIETGQTEDIEEGYIQDGREVIIHTVKTPVKDEQGNVIGVLGIFRDITERKKAEESVRKSEEKYRKLFEETTDAIFVADAETGILTDCNYAASELVGREKSELIGKHQRILHPPQEIEGEFSRTFKQHLREKNGQILEAQVITKKGEIRDVEIRADITEFEGKKLVLFGMFRDITERKQAEEALRQSEEQYRSVVENISIGVSIISPKMEILAMNRQMREWCPDIDVSKKPICYKSFNKPSRDDICSYCPTYKSLKDGQVHESITETPAGDEIENWRIISSPIKDKDGKVIAVIEMTEEITEQKKAEEALRKSKERYKALFEGAAEGILVVDIETKEFKYANPALCRMLGYTEKEIKGMRVHDFHPEESLEYVLSEFEAQARGEKILSPGIPCLRKDGTIMYADIKTGKIIMDRRECNLGFFTDITEHKRIKADLENYKDKVLKAQKHAYIGSMGAIVAHQVNQPLTKINILLDRAIEQIEEASSSPVALKNVKEGLDEVKNAASIIQKFRQYSKNSALESVGKVNVSAVADKIVSVLSERATRTNMRIAIKGLGDLPEVEANEMALEQIFLIIIQNAIEAADGRKRHKLDITGKFADGNIELRFADDCCGIAPENLDRIFEPFFSTKTEDMGLGLGLDIVQQLLISYGGEIRVESQLGKGTTFYVTVPASNTLKS